MKSCFLTFWESRALSDIGDRVASELVQGSAATRAVVRKIADWYSAFLLSLPDQSVITGGCDVAGGCEVPALAPILLDVRDPPVECVGIGSWLMIMIYACRTTST